MIKKLLYLVMRIFAMSRQEVHFRLTKPVRNRILRLKSSFGGSAWNDADFLSRFDVRLEQLKVVASEFHNKNYSTARLELAEYFKKRNRRRFFFDSSEIPGLLNSFRPDEKGQTIQKADEILKHNFQLFGLKTIAGRRINWHIDPTTGKQWPKVFRGAIQYRSSDCTADVKYIWELNRHKHLVTLGKAYVLTGDEKYAKEFCEQIKGWVEDNPAEIGVNWIDNLEVAMRSIAWVWAYYLFQDSPSLDESAHFTVVKSIYEHARHIFSELSIYSCANNHLIGEAAALWMVGLLFPEFKESQKWKSVGFEILVTELDRQVHPDGVHAEQGIGYHRFVLDFYTQVIVLAKRNDIEIPNEMTEKIEKMFEFILALVDCDGRVPMIGDSDDARGIPVADEGFWDFRDSLSTGAVLFNRSDMKRAGGRFHGTSPWLLGLAGKEKFDSLPNNANPSLSKAFADGGYYVMTANQGSEQMKLVFDCGPLGLPPRFGHGHADMLSFTVNAFGSDMLVDAGTFGYMYAGDKRHYFRGTKAHNTVVVDGLDQADPCGTSRWLNIPQARTHHWITTRGYDFVDASHNGYERLRNPITHRRMIFFVKAEYWVIVDSLHGFGIHTYDSYFHFSPGSVELDPISKRAIMTTGDGKNVLIAPSKPDSLSAAILEGSTSPFEGWISYSYGDKEPAPVLKYTERSQASVQFQTVISPFFGETSPLLTMSSVLPEEGKSQKLPIGLKVELNGFIDYFIYGQTGSKSWDKYQTDADLIYIRKDYSDQVQRVFALNISYLAVNSNRWLNSKTRFGCVEGRLVDGSIRITKHTPGEREKKEKGLHG